MAYRVRGKPKGKLKILIKGELREVRKVGNDGL